jgi:hypothetical protein
MFATSWPNGLEVALGVTTQPAFFRPLWTPTSLSPTPAESFLRRRDHGQTVISEQLIDVSGMWQIDLPE